MYDADILTQKFSKLPGITGLVPGKREVRFVGREGLRVEGSCGDARISLNLNMTRSSEFESNRSVTNSASLALFRPQSRWKKTSSRLRAEMLYQTSDSATEPGPTHGPVPFVGMIFPRPRQATKCHA